MSQHAVGRKGQREGWPGEGPLQRQRLAAKRITFLLSGPVVINLLRFLFAMPSVTTSAVKICYQFNHLLTRSISAMRASQIPSACL